MGVDGPRRRAGRSGGAPLNALVVPDVPSMHVDQGFWYAVPEGLSIEVGSVVRVPLGGRVVRGWVIRLDDDDRSDLKAIRRISGDHTVFDEALLETVQWVAQHYVAPVAVVLKKTSPPNLPRITPDIDLADLEVMEGPHRDLGEAAVEGQGGPPTVIVAAVAGAAIASAVAPVLAAGYSALIVLPTGVEAERYFEALGSFGRRRILVHPDMSDRQVTRRWAQLRQQSGLVAIGTERMVLWPIRSLRLAWIVGEGRRGLKARQTPTIDVRDVLRRRARAERLKLVMSSLVPSTEAMIAASRPVRLGGRVWPRTEVVDRGEDPPGGGTVSTRARAAIAAAVRDGRKVFVFTHRHGFAPAFRCVNCRTLRVCEVCEARAVGTAACTRCGAELGPCVSCAGRTFEPLGAGEGRVQSELSKVVGDQGVGPVGGPTLVGVGTERDIPSVEPVQLAVAVDADGLVFGTNYRAPETALRLLARVAATVARASGARFLVQTSRPSHPIIRALQRGEPLDVLEGILDARKAEGLPPFGELLVLDVHGHPAWLPERLRDLDAMVLGPIEARDHSRWLLQGANLDQDKHVLRSICQDIRDGGARVRVDANPLDL